MQVPIDPKTGRPVVNGALPVLPNAQPAQAPPATIGVRG